MGRALREGAAALELDERRPRLWETCRLVWFGVCNILTVLIISWLYTYIYI